MTDVAYSNPFTIRNAALTLGTYKFPSAVGACEVTPSYQNITYPTVDGGNKPIADDGAWVLSISYGQDHITLNALTRYLLEHDGEYVPFEYTPQAGGQGYSGTVLCRAGAIGGPARQHATSSVQLPLDGQPTVIPAA